MKLKLTGNTASYPILRLVSAGGKWEMGIAPAYCGVIVGCTHHLDDDIHFYNFFHLEQQDAPRDAKAQVSERWAGG
jgi:hypothetical protein